MFDFEEIEKLSREFYTNKPKEKVMNGTEIFVIPTGAITKSPSITDMYKAMGKTRKNPVGIVHTRKMLEAAISDGVFLRVKDAIRINRMLTEGWHVPREKVPQLIPLSYPFRKEIWDAVNFNREFTVARASTTFVGLWS